MWSKLVAEKPPGTCPADWWENTAKPACRDFCIAFSRLAAHRRRETAFFLQRALQQALETSAWPDIAILKSRLAQLADYGAQGAAVRGRHRRGGGQPSPVLQMAKAAHRPAPGLSRLKINDQVSTDPAEIEAEVLTYFGCLFQGRHTATAARPEPYDSGQPFQPNFDRLDNFLAGLPTLNRFQSELLDLPINLPELEQAAAAAGKAPGLDGLPYEFYRRVMPLIGPALVDALNTMLEQQLLTPSLRRGAVRLLPKVAGPPTAAQLRPITLLSCDYKLLTKVYVQRLIPLLPSILTTSQLCSVPGRSIFDGCTAILSAVEACRRAHRPGYLLNLDFFHAYDRVCMAYVDKVLAAFGFGQIFREVVATLHRGATATFLLHQLSPEVQVEFSIRQGDPLALLLFIIQQEPYLWRLEHQLPGLMVGDTEVKSAGYVDDVDALGDDDNDLPIIDTITRDFETVSGQILNRNRKSAILGLGTWSGRQDWPLHWLHAPEQLKVFGVTFAPSLQATITASWDNCVRGVQATISFWASRHLTTLRLKRDALEVFAFSKLWYLAQILPLPSGVAQRVATAAGAFLWRGHLERLAWQELHMPFDGGGLNLSCLQSRGQALLAKQTCWAIGRGGQAAQLWAYWIGQPLATFLPALALGQHARHIPPPWQDLATLLLELFQYQTVDPTNLMATTAANLYSSFMETPPPPKVTLRRPDLPWDTIWPRLWRPRLMAEEQNMAFKLLHNILPLRARMARFGLVAQAHCPHCPGVAEDTLHLFTACVRVANTWQQLVATLVPHTGPIQDEDLLFLAWPRMARDYDITVIILAFISSVWAARDGRRPPTFEGLTELLRLKPAPFLPLW
jgi:hypothetical protein